ncbi:hypothetical protein NLU13_2638 [Sarocladium strictum]|uniref:Uncharacterized protein n=1 Tax=Sarocladium strictum TaxID=5046 RepID=A0AA39GKK3_SARSR|nr:hypothetical protein NLU13_2638 [Sarocladium strictum]
MYLHRRRKRPSRHEADGFIDAGKRQIEDDLSGGFTVKVESIPGGQLVTLTHAIPNEALPTQQPDNPASSEPVVTFSQPQPEIALTTQVPLSSITQESSAAEAEAPVSSAPSAAQEPPVAETEAVFTTEALFSSDRVLPSGSSSTFSTSILPEVISATSAIATADADLESQANIQGDPDRVPAIGITIGALAGAGLVIGAGVMLYRYKHRKDVRVKSKDMRKFQEI